MYAKKQLNYIYGGSMTYYSLLRVNNCNDLPNCKVTFLHTVNLERKQ